MPLKRRVSKIYNVEEFVGNDVVLKEPGKPKAEPRGNVSEEEFFDFKIRRKSSVMPTTLHEGKPNITFCKIFVLIVTQKICISILITNKICFQPNFLLIILK